MNGLFDVLNSFFLDLQICGVRTSETECAKRNLEATGRIGITQKVIVVFDRAYPSIDMLNYLDEMGMFYIFRAGSRCFCDERRRATGNDGWLEIRHTAHRLENIKERDIQRYGELRKHRTNLVDLFGVS